MWRKLWEGWVECSWFFQEIRCLKCKQIYFLRANVRSPSRETGHTLKSRGICQKELLGAEEPGTETSLNAFLLTLGLNSVPNPKSVSQMGCFCHNYC